MTKRSQDDKKSMFRIIKKSTKSSARVGRVQTSHGVIETPFFMPDATRGFIKGLDNGDLQNLGLQAMVINTYHLYLQPGIPLIKKAKGAHVFMNWEKPLLSDSGGYQVYSLVHKNKAGRISDGQVIFNSPFDGSRHKLTPEKSIQIQFDLGADMIVCLDDCPPHNVNKKKMSLSVERTIAWARRCKKEYEKQIKKNGLNNRKPLLFAVIQGGTDLAMRKKCAEALVEIDFHGYGFGARPVDTKGNFLTKVLQETADLIPGNSLRFGLGIGLPEDIVHCAKMGWDMFDCVIPTREGRHGRLFQWKRSLNSKFQNPKQIQSINFKISKKIYKALNITNAKFKKDFSVINEYSNIPALRKYSKAYLHHLFKVGDSLGARLASLNNLEFYLDLMKEVREGIKDGRL